MAGNSSPGKDRGVIWISEDELETPVSSCANPILPGRAGGFNEGSTSAGPSNTKLIDHFVAMGFSEKLVAKAIKENGEQDTEAILNALLTYSALDNSPELQESVGSEQSPELPIDSKPYLQQPLDSAQCSSDYGDIFVDDMSDLDSSSDSEEITNPVAEEDSRLLYLVEMGYTADEASIAIQRCGADASIDELADIICAAQMAREANDSFPYETKPTKSELLKGKLKKRKYNGYELSERNKPKKLSVDDELIRIPKPMIGYGIPGESSLAVRRTLPEAAMGPPFFYYENVAIAPKGVWNTISRFLYDIEPEFVDSKYFCAAARKRGYVHNLPVDSRYPLLPLPPRTIFEAFPLTKKWWPSWDPRTNLNCLQTCIGSAKLTERIRKLLEGCDGVPPLGIQKTILDECRKWNLVWVGKNKVAPLEPDEVEMLLGFPRNHTRGGGISRTDRYKSLGNSFQVDTVAYHLSALREIFPDGINLLSLFSGIGGAEVALHRLGIPLKNVVSVEISEVNRNIVRSWWEQTNQTGNLIHIADVQRLGGDLLEQYMNSFGAFDLVVGGSPCNNLAGSNRHHRDGLEGKESVLFYDYFRILDLVKGISSRSR